MVYGHGQEPGRPCRSSSANPKLCSETHQIWFVVGKQSAGPQTLPWEVSQWHDMGNDVVPYASLEKSLNLYLRSFLHATSPCLIQQTLPALHISNSMSQLFGRIRFLWCKD